MFKWILVDPSRLNPKHCKLPEEQRQSLYSKLTQRFTIELDADNNYKSNGLSPKDLCSTLHQQPVFYEMVTIIFYFLAMSCYFFPLICILLSIYLMYYAYVKSFVFVICTYLMLSFYPIKRNHATLRNVFIYSLIQYCSWKICYHAETYKYMKETHKNLIFMSIPHGVLPLSTIISSLITPDLFNKNEEIPTTASVMFYLPFIRNIAYHLNYRTVSKESIKNILLNLKRCVFIAADGINGIFLKQSDYKNYKNSEVIQLKHKKGISKIALQTGSNVAIAYGFGNTQVMDCWFDPYGILKWISKKLKLSLIILYGRFYLPIPKRVPLYYVIGPIVKNKYENNQIINPTQQQIDEYHQKILAAATTLFEQHKNLYGWNNKNLVFV